MLRNSLVNTPPGICLANSRRERTERGVYAASRWDNPCDLSEVPDRQEVRTVKRSEGRAPDPSLVGTLNRYPAFSGVTEHAPKYGTASAVPQLSTVNHQLNHVSTNSIRILSA